MQLIQVFRSALMIVAITIAFAGRQAVANAASQATPLEHPDMTSTVGSIAPSLSSAVSLENTDTSVVAATSLSSGTAANTVANISLASSASQTPAATTAADAPQDTTPLPHRLRGSHESLKARLQARMAADPAAASALPPADEPNPLATEEPWRLFHGPTLDRYGLQIQGWVDQGLSFNDDGSHSPYNGPVANDDRNGEYQLNQAWLSFDRAVCRDGCGWDVGGHVDLVYGTDWRYDVNHGLEDRINGLNDQTYGMSIPQAYMEVTDKNLSMKLGHMFANMDVESFASPNNFFYSHSYCFTYCVPKEVTGVVADYQIADNLSCQAGFHRGWNEFEDNNDTLDFIGGFRWTSSDKRTSLAYTLTNGPQDPAGMQNRFIYNLVFQEDLTKRAQYVLEHDLGVESNAVPGGRQAMWYGLNNYYRYALSERWSTCLRAEWLRDQDGVIVTGPGNDSGLRSWVGHGFAGDFYEVTAGLNWKPQANVTFRPEVRYDWYDGAQGVYGPSNTAGLPFNNGRSSTQLLTAADVIVVF
jgi:hypothetical protein